MSEQAEREEQGGKGIPVYLDQREPEIDDPAADACWHRSQPANPLTDKLVRCVESLRSGSI
jgi:hypothetical protein